MCVVGVGLRSVGDAQLLIGDDLFFPVTVPNRFIFFILEQANY